MCIFSLRGGHFRCGLVGAILHRIRFANVPFYDRLEERRKAKGAAYYERKKVAARQLTEAKKNAKVDPKTAKALEAFGY